MQEAAEAAAAASNAVSGVVELYSLAHLDAVVDAAGPGIVAICFYSRVSYVAFLDAFENTWLRSVCLQPSEQQR